MKRRCSRPISSDGAPTSRALPVVFLVVGACYLSISHSVYAVTLDAALQTTLEKNPAIQEAKSGLEQAAGQRLVLRSIAWPSAGLDVPVGLQGGHRGGQNGIKGFVFARGYLTQTLLNAAVAPSFRRGDAEVLIAQQQLNVAVVEQLHQARLAFYAALYNRSLQSIREEQRGRLEENAGTQKNRYEAGLANRSAFTSATVEARELDPQIEKAHRAYLDAQLKLAEAMAINPGGKTALPEPDGELKFAPVSLNVDSARVAALERRADLKLARLLVRAANDDQRIIAAAYYPAVAGNITGDYIPVTGVHRQGSTSRTQDISSEIVEKAGYTWWVIDNGKVGGAVLRARATREVNELACRKLEASVGREVQQIANNIKAIEERERSFEAATASAEESAKVVQQNMATGLASPLEYRVTQNEFLNNKSGLLDTIYQHNLARAEWDRATGRYFQFADDNATSR